jgi:GT2 family glycosyltransferase
LQNNLLSGIELEDAMRVTVYLTEMASARSHIVIPYYLGESFLIPCLKSLAESDRRIDEVVVVDNCPVSICTETLPKNFPFQLTVLRTKPGIGFGRACNVGIKYSIERGADVAVILNQDTKVEPQAMGELIVALDRNPNAFAAGPVSLSYSGDTIQSKTIETYLAPHSELIRDLLLSKAKSEYELPYNGMNAACVALAMKHWEKVGGFDPLFHMYGEEFDLFFRAIQRGLQIILVPSARIRHFHSNFSADSAKKFAIMVQSVTGNCIRIVKNRQCTLPMCLFRIANWTFNLLINVRSPSEFVTFLRATVKLPYILFVANRHHRDDVFRRSTESALRADWTNCDEKQRKSETEDINVV